MRRICFVSVWCFICFCFSSCVFSPTLEPVGTWTSEDGKLVINFSEDGFGENAGTIEVEESICPLYWQIFIDQLSVYTIEAWQDGVMYDDRFYFDGHLRYSDEILTIEVVNSHIEEYPTDTKIPLIPYEGAKVNIDYPLPWFLEDVLD